MGIKNKTIWIISVIIALVLSMSSCSDGKNSSSNNGAIELSDTQTESLLKQAAESESSGYYGDELKDYRITVEPFAVAEIFGVDKDGDQGKAYAYLRLSYTVVHKDNAYELSGGAGEVILNFKYGENDVTLSDVEWSADGDLHNSWMNENFPAAYLNKANVYDPYDGNGKSVLDAALREKIEKTLGVPLETEKFLETDTDKGTYEIWKAKNDSGASFDTETIETGKLEDL